jgi:gliding motility-associated-like protein
MTPGTYNTRLLVLFDDRSCEAEVTLPVEIPTLPTAAFDILDRQLLLPRDPVEVVYTGQDAVQLVWSWGDGQQTVVNTNLRSLVSHTYADQGTYLITLTATDINGCVVTDTGSVATFRSNEIVVPTAFSPNGDNVNETWRGYTPFRFENYLLQVFNRWGRVIFETRDEFEEWDGRYNGQPVQQDAYVWKITAIDDKGLVKELVGTVTVVR